MNKIIIPDTSLVISLLTKEATSQTASKIYSHILTNSLKLIAPTYLQIEFHSVLRKKIHFSKLSLPQSKKTLNFFYQIPIKFFPQTPKSLNHAFQLAHKLKQPTIYDTVFLSLAIKKNAIYITNDKKFAKKTKIITKNCLTLQEALTSFSS
jgi:predicted nucleic acid-binding protein